ncbi:ADP-ribosyltransferase [Arthrobacter phage Atuin]|nr:ADP-ribosyltransferase [Arthrobacter phage Atuin]
MSFTIIEGDLFDPELGFTSLAQGTNCRGVMGAGIAVPFKEKYPDMFDTYEALCLKAPHLLPGTAQVFLMDADDDRPDVINIFSQFNPGEGNATYEYLERGLHSMDQQLTLLTDAAQILISAIIPFHKRHPFNVGLPLIGGGIGGLKRHNIIHLMEMVLSDSEHSYTLVERV